MTSQPPAFPASPMFATRRAARSLCVAALALASLYILVVGSARTALPASRPLDLSYFIVAGQLWLEGTDPYDPAAFAAHHARFVGRETGEAMHGPPQFIPLAILLALPDYDTAKRFLTLGNTVAAFALPALAIGMARSLRPLRPAASSLATWTLLPAGILLLNGVYRQIVLGQVTLLVAVALLGGWLLTHRGRPILGGILLGLSTVKPQYALLPLLWLLLDRRWPVLAAALATALGLGLTQGLPAAVAGWLAGVRHYDTMPYNALGYGMIMGLPSTLASLGLPMPTAPALSVVAIAGVLAARFTLPRLHPVATLGLLLGIQLVLAYGKYLELPLLAPALAVLWWRHAHDPRRVAVAAALLLPLWLPERVYIATGHFDQLGHLRMLPILVGAILFLPAALQTQPPLPPVQKGISSAETRFPG